MKKIFVTSVFLLLILTIKSQEIHQSKVRIKMSIELDSIIPEIETFFSDSLHYEIISIDDPILTDSIQVGEIHDTITHWFFPDDIINSAVVVRHEIHFHKNRKDQYIAFIYSYVSIDPEQNNASRRKLSKYARTYSKTQVIDVIKESLFNSKE